MTGTGLSKEQASAYWRDGHIGPVRIFTAAEVDELLVKFDRIFKLLGPGETPCVDSWEKYNRDVYAWSWTHAYST